MNKNMFRHTTKAGNDFQDAMFNYKADFVFNEMVPDTYYYTKLFCLWKGKGSKLDLNMMRYIRAKDWDANLLEALISERMKPSMIKNFLRMLILLHKAVLPMEWHR